MLAGQREITCLWWSERIIALPARNNRRNVPAGQQANLPPLVAASPESGQIIIRPLSLSIAVILFSPSSPMPATWIAHFSGKYEPGKFLYMTLVSCWRQLCLLPPASPLDESSSTPRVMRQFLVCLREAA